MSDSFEPADSFDDLQVFVGIGVDHYILHTDLVCPPLSAMHQACSYFTEAPFSFLLDELVDIHNGLSTLPHHLDFFFILASSRGCVSSTAPWSSPVRRAASYTLSPALSVSFGLADAAFHSRDVAHTLPLLQSLPGGAHLLHKDSLQRSTCALSLHVYLTFAAV